MRPASCVSSDYYFGSDHNSQGMLRMNYKCTMIYIALLGVFVYTCLLINVQEISIMPNIGMQSWYDSRSSKSDFRLESEHGHQKVFPFGPWQYAVVSVIENNLTYTDTKSEPKGYRAVDNITSARFSTYTLLNTSSLRRPRPLIGDVIHFVIESHDFKGNPQAFGGDIWKGVLSVSSRKAYTAGRVTDYNNGTYLMTFVLSWSGKTRVEVTLVYPRRVTNWMRTRFRTDDHAPIWHGTFKRGQETKKSNCYLTYGRILSYNTHVMCDYKNNGALTLTKFFCRKPAGFRCEDLVGHRNVLPYGKITANVMRKNQLDIFEGFGRYKTIEGSPVTLRVDGNYEETELASSPRLKLPSCGPDLPITVSDGYWMNGTWKSLVCKPSLAYSPSIIRKCFKNYNVYLTGDSTVRQWFFSLIDALSITIPGGIDKAKMRYHYSNKSNNFNLTFTFHPLTYHISFPVNISQMRFETDVLLNLPRHTCNHVVVVSPWAHFITWPWEAYVEWLTNIKSAIFEARKLCPDIKVVIKSPHPVENQQTSRSMMGVDILYWDMKSTLRDIFEGSHVLFVDTWDMNQVYPEPNDLHMPNEVVNQEIALFLSYICS